MHMMTVRPVVLQHGSSTRRRIYVICLGQAPDLAPSQSGAASSYRVVVGRPAVTLNIPAELHIAFRSKVADQPLWIHVKSFVGPGGQLFWNVMAGAEPSRNSPYSRCNQGENGGSVSEIGAVTDPSAFAEDHGRLRGDHAQYAAVSVSSFVSVSEVSVNIHPSSCMCRTATRMRKRLTDSADVLSQLRKQRKTLRQENKRIRLKKEWQRASEPLGLSWKPMHDAAGAGDSQLEEDLTSYLRRAPTTSLISECLSRAQEKGFAPIIGLRFAASMLENSMTAKNHWRWSDWEVAFFSNLLSRIGLHSYRFVASELGAPSVTTIQQVAGIDARDLLFSASMGVRKLAAYFDENPVLSRRVIIQHDGIHVRQGVVWTKFHTFVGLVEQRESIAHFVLDEPDLHSLEFAHTAEVFMLSVPYTGIKHVVRAAPCSSGFSSIDYVSILNELLECLDCHNIRPSALCFDAAAPVVKGLKSLAAFVRDERPTTSHGGHLASSGSKGVEETFSDGISMHSECPGSDSGAVSADEIVHMFAEQQQPLNRIGQSIFGTSSVPAELLRSIAIAHRRFPVYFVDPFSKEGVLLCGDPAHLLKRERYLLYSTRSARRFVQVSYENQLVQLRWEHVASLRSEDKAAKLRGLPMQEPLLTDSFVNLNSWGKMSVPGALAVYSTRVIAALRRKAEGVKSLKHRLELEALAFHLEYGRSRFDVARSMRLNLRRKSPLETALKSYDTPVIELMAELEAYYLQQLQYGSTNNKSSIWAELVSSSVAMRSFVWRETRTAPENGYLLLTHLSTDPLESLFSFIRQNNGGSTNPSMEQLIQGLRRHSTRDVSRKLLRGIKGNLEPERNEKMVQEIFLASAVVGQAFSESRTSELRAQIEQQKQSVEDESTLTAIIRAANQRSTSVVDLRTLQVTARICGALVAIERKNVTKKITRLEKTCDGHTTNVPEAAKEKWRKACTDLQQIDSWTLPSQSSLCTGDMYADIRFVERHDRLTYPVPAIVNAMATLVELRHYAVEHVLSGTNKAYRLPIVLSRLFQNKSVVNDLTTADCDVLRRLVNRFTNSSCRSLQSTLNARCEELTTSRSSRGVDANVALRPKLAVRSATAVARYS